MTEATQESQDLLEILEQEVVLENLGELAIQAHQD